jgi:hypothetical protein
MAPPNVGYQCLLTKRGPLLRGRSRYVALKRQPYVSTNIIFTIQAPLAYSLIPGSEQIISTCCLRHVAHALAGSDRGDDELLFLGL